MNKIGPGDAVWEGTKYGDINERREIYSPRKVGMPCFVVLMSVYLSYHLGNLCVKIQVQFRLLYIRVSMV